MSTFTAEEYRRRQETIHGWPVNVTSYRLLDRYLCKIDNVSPGATIARGEGATREAAEKEAVEQVTRRLQLTQALRDTRRALEELQQAGPDALRAGVDALRQQLRIVPDRDP
jgi:hypothetical protein